MSIFDDLGVNGEIETSLSVLAHPVASMSTELKQQYLSILALISRANKIYHPTEKAMLETIANSFGLAETHVEESVKAAKDAEILTDALATWKEQTLRDVLFLDMCRIAAADGTICDSEKKFLQHLVGELDISERKNIFMQQIALALKYFSADNNLAWFDKTIAQAGLDAEHFAFIRSEFVATAPLPSGEIAAQSTSQDTRKQDTTQSLPFHVIRDCQENVLSHLAMLQNTLEKCKPTGSGKYALASEEDIRQFISQINEEHIKVEQLRMTLAFIGPMKSGKSTLINAIVGVEVLPSRSGAMTTLPTLITHTDGCKEPVLRFPKPEPFDDLIKSISKKLKSIQAISDDVDGSDYQQTLMRIQEGELTQIKREYKGEAGICSFMKDLNDLVRISQLPDFELESPLSAYKSIDDFPEIEVEFVSLTNRVSGTLGKLTLVDTPGPNEAGQGHLQGVVKQQLKQAAAIVVVVAPTQKDSVAFSEIRGWVHDARTKEGVPLYVFLNKFDEMLAAERKVENVEPICVRLFPEIIQEDATPLTVKGRTFPSSALPALLANKVIRALDLTGQLPDPNCNSWVLDFARHAYGPSSAKRKIKDASPEEHRQESEYLWQHSLMEHPLREVITASLHRAAPLCLDSAVTKIIKIGKDLSDQARGTRTSLERSMNELRQAMSKMGEQIKEIEGIRKKLQKTSKTAVGTIQRALEKPLDEMIHDAKGFITGLAKDKGEELQKSKKKKEEEMRRSQKPFAFFLYNIQKDLRGDNRDRIEEIVTGKDPLEFNSEEDAADFSKKLNNVIKKQIKKALQKTIEGIGPILDAEQEKLAQQMAGRLQPIIDTLAEDAKKLFDIELSPPKPELPRIHIDLDIIACIDVDKHTETKSYRERNPWTLWICKRTITYTVQSYCIDPRLVRRNLESMLREKIVELKNTVTDYINGSFGQMMHDYFLGLTETVGKAQAITEKGIEAKKLDVNDRKIARKKWQDTEEELNDFKDAVTATKGKLQEAEMPK